MYESWGLLREYGRKSIINKEFPLGMRRKTVDLFRKEPVIKIIIEILINIIPFMTKYSE